MPCFSRLSDQSFRTCDDFPRVVVHLGRSHDLNVKGRIPLVDIPSGKRVPQRIQVASVPIWRTYRSQVRIVEVAGFLPCSGVKRYGYNLTVLSRRRGWETGLPSITIRLCTETPPNCHYRRVGRIMGCWLMRNTRSVRLLNCRSGLWVNLEWAFPRDLLPKSAYSPYRA
jgi:hypothetical protein